MNAKELTNEIMNLLEDMDMLDYDREETEEELEEGLYWLQAAKDNKYNSPCFSTLWGVITSLVEKVQDLEINC